MWLRGAIKSLFFTAVGTMKAKDAMTGLTPLEEAQKIVLDATPVLAGS